MKKLIAPIVVIFIVLLAVQSQCAVAQVTYETEIVISTSHIKTIQDSFKTAFEAYAKDVLKVTVTVRMDPRASEDVYKLAKEWAGKPQSDVWWGGGVDLFAKAASEGLLMAYKAKNATKVPDQWFGIPAKDKDGYWTGYALSGFGFAVNTDYLKKYNLPEPKSYADLLNPAYRGHIVMCTPGRSGSTHMLVEIYLQGAGVDQGWAYWRRMATNVGLFTPRSADVITDVNKGEHGIGLVVDYYGFESALAGLPVKLVYPSDYALANPDSIAILGGSPHPNLAKAFIEYVLSDEGQKLSMGIAQRGVKNPSPRVTIRPDLPVPAYLPDLTKLKAIKYDSNLGSQRYNDVNKMYEESIEKKIGDLKGAWDKVESAQSLVAEYKVLFEEMKSKGYDITAASAKLAEAESKIKDAMSAFDKGDYQAAVAAATDSLSIAGAARLMLEPQKPPEPPRYDLYILGIGVIVIIALVAYAYTTRKKPTQK